jgi:hypothetical protein
MLLFEVGGVVGSLLQGSLPSSTLVVAIDPGKVHHRVGLSTDAAGLVTEPLTLPVLRPSVEALDRLVRRYSAEVRPVFAIEATGGLHRAWAELQPASRIRRPATSPARSKIAGRQ